MIRRIPARSVLALVLACALDARADGPHAAPQAPDARFDPRTVRAPEGSALARARAAFALGHWDEAHSIALDAAGTAAEPERSRLLWVAARAVERTGEVAGASALLDPVANGSSPLAAWARVLRAEWIEARAPEQAVAVAEAARGDAPWPGRARADAVLGRIAARGGHPDEAIARLEPLAQRLPEQSAGISLVVPLAEALAARGDEASRERAIELYRRVESRAPLGRSAADARARIAELLALLPEARRTALAEPSIDDAGARADSLERAMRHGEARDAWAALAARVAGDPARRCDALVEQGRAMYLGRERAEAGALLAAAAGDCPAGEARARARYWAGRSYAARDAHADAIAQYDALAREAPTSRLADDGLMRAALAAHALGDDDGMRQRLGEITSQHASGDMKGEARFALAWHEREAGHYDVALAELERSLAEGPAERDEDLPGRAAYWRARALLDLGRPADAATAYEALVAAHPLTYYGTLAIARLVELAPERATAARTVLGAPGPDVALFPPRPELDSPAFARVLELLRVGESDLATDELRAMGLLSEGADPNALWLAAALLAEADAPSEPVRLSRDRLATFAAVAPRGPARALWRIAYPRAFAPAIEDAAREATIPPALLRAIAREETSFDPSAASAAHAFGLVQLTVATATRIGRPLGLAGDRDALLDPANNVRIGARYLAALWQRYAGNAVLVAAAYNAGEGAVDRWLRERGALPLDEFVETIPYEETRRYARRVLRTYASYAWLDGQELVVLPAATRPPAHPSTSPPPQAR